MRNKGLLKTSLLIFVAWILDLLSSAVGLMMGISEVSPFFWLFPAMWMLLYLSLAALIYFFKWAPAIVRGSLLLVIVIISFVPSIRNTMGILLMVIL